MFALIMGVVSANAQIATENSKFFDNFSVGVTAGLTTPLDFNSMFPLNTNFGLKVQKDVTPVVGFQVEGLFFVGDNHFADLKTFMKATNLGVNNTLNLSNLFWGYKGTPRKFEVSTNAGIGWLHIWDTKRNYLTAKTALDLAFNLGQNKANSIVVSPEIYWNLSATRSVQFNKHYAQLGLNVSFVHHFMTSNGTRHFKTYDVGALIDENNRLWEENKLLKNAEPKVVNRVVEKVINVEANNQWVVQFAQGSCDLTDEAKSVLNVIAENSVVDIVGTSSPEGGDERNQKLSEFRAAAVADYLRARGVKVNSWEGKGVQIGLSTNRLAIITLVK